MTNNLRKTSAPFVRLSWVRTGSAVRARRITSQYAVEREQMIRKKKQCWTTLLGYGLLCLSAVMPAVSRADFVAAPVDPFALTLDLGQGFSLRSNNAPVTPYLFNVKLTPEYKFSDFSLGAILATRYADPSWEAGLGLRLDYLFWKVVPDTGIRLSAEATPWLNSPNTTLELGLVGDLSGLTRVGAWCGYDTRDQGWSLMASFGFDLAALWRAGHPKVPQPVFGN
jgi:hypothetical protein